jgi:hypothetical protein
MESELILDLEMCLLKVSAKVVLHNQNLLHLSDHHYHHPVRYHRFLRIPGELDLAMGLCLVGE